MAQVPYSTEIASATIAGQFPTEVSLQPGIFNSGREIPNSAGAGSDRRT